MKQFFLFIALLALPMMARPRVSECHQARLNGRAGADSTLSSAQGTTIVSTDSLVQKEVWRETWTEINRNGDFSEDNESNL